MKISPLIPIGTKLTINKSKISNRLTKNSLEKLPKLINGEIIDYKMTDGMGIGYVLMTENNFKIWIFQDELNIETRIKFNIEKEKKNTIYKSLLKEYIKDYELKGTRKVKELTNPIHLLNWLLFTLKDII